MLLSSKKFGDKAEEVLKKGLEGRPKHVKLEKKVGGADPVQVTLGGPEDGEGGMMLYTSGTTNRPVGYAIMQCFAQSADWISERSSAPSSSHDGTIKISPNSMELYSQGPPSPCTSSTPHPWDN
jgi:hypothetical protein